MDTFFARKVIWNQPANTSLLTSSAGWRSFRFLFRNRFEFANFKQNQLVWIDSLSLLSTQGLKQLENLDIFLLDCLALIIDRCRKLLNRSVKLQPIAIAITKHKQVPTERVLLNDVRRHPAESVKRSPHVSR